MAASTVTIDASEWEYIDKNGIGHVVTAAQTFTLTVTDGGAAAVEYSIPVGQSVTTTDGYNINILPNTDGDNTANSVHYLADANQGSDNYSISGEFKMSIDSDNAVQIWKVAKINPSDADYGSAGTIGFTLEDQFGNSMSVSGVTVGQAA